MKKLFYAVAIAALSVSLTVPALAQIGNPPTQIPNPNQPNRAAGPNNQGGANATQAPVSGTGAGVAAVNAAAIQQVNALQQNMQQMMNDLSNLRQVITQQPNQ
jgi:hypothetical protein